MSLNESHVEDAALEWFGALGYQIWHGPQLAPCEPAAERESFGAVVLREAIWRLTPAILLSSGNRLRDTLLPKLLCGEVSVVGAPTGHDAIAQGNALGRGGKINSSPERA